MVPVYGLLMVSQRLIWLRRFIASHFVPFVLCLGWIVAIVATAVDVGSSGPQVVERVVVSLHGGVAALSAAFTESWFAAISWLQLLMLDFLMAREVALDAWELNVFAVHSLLLCFMCGPVGYLSHLATKKAFGKA